MEAKRQTGDEIDLLSGFWPSSDQRFPGKNKQISSARKVGTSNIFFFQGATTRNILLVKEVVV